MTALKRKIKIALVGLVITAGVGGLSMNQVTKCPALAMQGGRCSVELFYLLFAGDSVKNDYIEPDIVGALSVFFGGRYDPGAASEALRLANRDLSEFDAQVCLQYYKSNGISVRFVVASMVRQMCGNAASQGELLSCLRSRQRMKNANTDEVLESRLRQRADPVTESCYRDAAPAR